jgi:hypothetical protein
MGCVGIIPYWGMPNRFPQLSQNMAPSELTRPQLAHLINFPHERKRVATISIFPSSMPQGDHQYRHNEEHHGCQQQAVRVDVDKHGNDHGGEPVDDAVHNESQDQDADYDENDDSEQDKQAQPQEGQSAAPPVEIWNERGFLFLPANRGQWQTTASRQDAQAGQEALQLKQFPYEVRPIA